MEHLDTVVCLPVVAIETESVTRRQGDVPVTSALTDTGDRVVS